MLGLESLILKLTLTQYYKENLFKYNLLINYNISTSVSQIRVITFFIILLPVSEMVCSTSLIIASVSECINHRPWDTETSLHKNLHDEYYGKPSTINKIKA